jgi:hypothetical protein
MEFRRLLLLPSAILALSVSQALASALQPRAAESNTTVPAPVSFTPDENWDGIDGTWSTFTLRVGTPSQYIRVYASFNSYQNWVVLPQGCDAAQSYSSCAQTRGGIFNQSASTTFDEVGIYDLWIEQDLGYSGNAIFGYDVVGLGGQGENGPTIQNCTVGGLAVEDFYLGLFGMSPKPTNFTSFNEPSPSYMTLLKEQNYIPSISAGYTAGAPYRFTKVLASLTLGGYNEWGFIANDVEFAFAADNDRDLVLAVQSITTPSNDSSSPAASELLPNPIYVFLDTSIPQIWLPPEACRAFEEVFGIYYDNTTELYFINDTQHRLLQNSNPNITFTLAQGLSGGSTVEITLPYSAFDHVAKNPYQGVSKDTNYFPLRRAANDSQYTIGRVFFQEAYLTVDWERQRFNVSAVNWTENAAEYIVAILPYNGTDNPTNYSNQTTTTAGKSSGISDGAIAGIAVGSVAIVALLTCLLLWIWKRRSKASKEDQIANEKLPHEDVNIRGRQANVIPKAELEGSSPLPPGAMDADNRRLLSVNGSNGPGTPGTQEAPSSTGYFGRDTESPSTPTNGEGTHSSSQSNNGSGSHTHSVLSPLSPSNTSEADSKERHVFEMAGDMPTIKEKDGKSLTEKEAMQHRERKYNGVETVPTPTPAEDGAPREPPRRINPADVVRTDVLDEDFISPIGVAGASPGDFRRHRAFSFEDDRPSGENSEELYSNSQ